MQRSKKENVADGHHVLVKCTLIIKLATLELSASLSVILQETYFKGKDILT